MVRKYQGWEIRLDNFVQTVRNRPFDWSNHNCALFVCDCIREMTGNDLAEDFRGNFESKESAYHFLNEKGFQNLREVVIDRLGSPYQNINYAKRGDVVLIEHMDGGYALGLVDLSGRAAWVTGENGLESIPKKQWLEAWGIE